MKQSQRVDSRPLIEPRKFRAFGRRHIDRISQIQHLDADTRLAMKAVASVLPFRVNEYVTDELIDWDRIPDDPIYQLTFPQREMLAPEDFSRMVSLLRAEASSEEIECAARDIQGRMNPHPAGQIQLNVPSKGGEPIPGIQHKYRETVLFFPAQGQTCHSYCTYCFRWAQFVGIEDLKFASSEAESLVSYLKEHPEVTSVLFTGGDPMIMKTAVLRAYIEPLLRAGLDHVNTIRIGTKAPAYWPYRFVTDGDADDLLRLFEEVRAAGKQLAVMAHFSHTRELETPIAQEALRRIQDAGAVVRCQAPIIKHVNDSADVWRDMWRLQVKLGAVPYYMFVERDTGPKKYFEVPLADAHAVFQSAFSELSGLGRTVRGPSMSATPGKVVVDGIADVAGQQVFVLRFLQARNPAWVGQPFFAKFDPTATWLDQLEPAFGQAEFFFQAGLREMNRLKKSGVQPCVTGPEIPEVA